MWLWETLRRGKLQHCLPLPSIRPELGMQLWQRHLCQGRQELGETSHQEGFPTAIFRSFSLTLTSVVVRAFIYFVQVSSQIDTRLVHCLPVTRHQRRTQLTPTPGQFTSVGNVQKWGWGGEGIDKVSKGHESDCPEEVALKQRPISKEMF